MFYAELDECSLICRHLLLLPSRGDLVMLTQKHGGQQEAGPALFPSLPDHPILPTNAYRAIDQILFVRCYHHIFAAIIRPDAQMLRAQEAAVPRREQGNHGGGFLCTQNDHRESIAARAGGMCFESNVVVEGNRFGRILFFEKRGQKTFF